MCDSCIVEPPKSGRHKLWEISGGLQCAIVGTCLSHDDLVRLAPKLGLQIEPNAPPYDVHGYFVHHAASDTPIARALQKLLDSRFSGIVRKVSRLKDAKALAELWEAEYEAGRVPGAFWAFMSCATIPSDLRHRVFGEVHMLSHLLGHATHRKVEEVSKIEATASERDIQLRRQRERHARALSERDAEIEKLRSELVSVRSSQAQSPSHRPSWPDVGSKAASRAHRQDRALTTARHRARSAEQRNEALARRCEQLQARLNMVLRTQSLASRCAGAEACSFDAYDHEPPSRSRKLLYLGGRRGSVEKLREIAERCQVEFLYHDGGMEDAFHRIDKLVEGSDAVFCPVDCISHGACQHAKRLCQKYCKSFVVLKSAGGATFARALDDYIRAA